MRLPAPRGPHSYELIQCMRGDAPEPGQWTPAGSVLDDDDFQISLWTLYELHYGGFEDAQRSGAEWDPALLNARRGLELQFERALTQAVADHLSEVVTDEDVVDGLEALIGGFDGESVAGHLQKRGTPDQIREVLAQRSILQLKEADPYSWVIPRLSGAAKVALVELLFDEYGAGRPDRLHQLLYARTMREVGLESERYAYIDLACPQILAVANAATFFGLHRRLRGAAMGHLAAFESTSSIPSRQYATAIRKAGFSDAAALYFDEHAEADAVHEQLASRGVCGSLVAQHPSLAQDVLFGAAACLVLDERFGQLLLSLWREGSLLVDAATLGVTSSESP